MDEHRWGFWSFRSLFTAAVGNSQIVLSSGAGNLIEILALRVTLTATATETLDVELINEDGQIITSYVDLAAATSNIATLPRLNDDVNTTTSALRASSFGVILSGGQDLNILTSGLTAGDTLEVLVWAKVLKGRGVFTTVMSSAESVSEVY